MSKWQRAGRTLAALTAVTMLLGSGQAAGDERVVSRSLKALDVLCLETQLDRLNLDAQVRLFKHRRLTSDALDKMSPYNETGYAVLVENSPITVTWGRRLDRRGSEDGISRNCTVTIKDLAFADAEDLLQSKFSAETVDRFTYGHSQVAIYRAALADYAADMFFSVQSGLGITAISFFETPSAETPSAETPSAETPSAKTPSAETPGAKSGKPR